jgi:hypothetical protein
MEQLQPLGEGFKPKISKRLSHAATFNSISKVTQRSGNTHTQLKTILLFSNSNLWPARPNGSGSYAQRIRALPACVPKLIFWDIFSFRISLSERLGETGFEGSLLPLFSAAACV